MTDTPDTASGPSPALPESPLPGQAPRKTPDDRAAPEAQAINEMWRQRPWWARRAEAFFHLARIKLAHAVLLPELSPDQAFDLRQSVRQEGQLTRGYILMCALAAGIAILGLLQSSTAVVIGAMLVSPLMSPIAAMGFGFASLDGHRIRDAVKVVAIGAAIGIATGIVLTWLSPIRNATPEILARTEPNLLDLAVALFSGIAGGYSTVIGKGGTAIGVAIATALMPPLTVVGYGIGVLQPMFAFGALLLFLTNLAAITFAFALIARLSGAARPFGKVEWTPRYIAILIAAFLALATPLTMTLMKLTNEARIRSAAQNAIVSACGDKNVTIAQLDVNSSLFAAPSVKALVITPTYTGNAESRAESLIKKALGEQVAVSLQQVLAADVRSQTKAMVDAAMERTTAGIAADVPPFKTIRQTIGLPTRAMWTDRAQRMVYVEPVPAPEWTLADYRTVETSANQDTTGWTVRLIPPPQADLRVALGHGAGAALAEGTIPVDLGIWALQRWGMGDVTISGASAAQLAGLSKLLSDAGIAAQVRTRPELAQDEPTAEATPLSQDGQAASPDAPATAIISVYAPSPSRLAAQKAAREAALRAAAQQDAEAAKATAATPPKR
ncbi:TIGR00341 family protein [Novosphingobium sp. 1949]|uniref:TIGR00341 family protein n=1 Tax=Novosphingobium organovorum TaxID=2930092 RepID=A0ABT0B8L3_9SPHN|nr:TIGR00341 family protein [Novosphingobium organovorum]MCJ2181382.1 TIGR00341 family protein [Novosphingobium organovorum]